jgi:hypothetical protein
VVTTPSASTTTQQDTTAHNPEKNTEPKTGAPVPNL